MEISQSLSLLDDALMYSNLAIQNIELVSQSLNSPHRISDICADLAQRT